MRDDAEPCEDDLDVVGTAERLLGLGGDALSIAGAPESCGASLAATAISTDAVVHGASAAWNGLKNFGQDFQNAANADRMNVVNSSSEGAGGGSGAGSGQDNNPPQADGTGNTEGTGNGRYLRQKAVKQAWQQEQELVKSTGQGTRPWTDAEKQELLQTGKVQGYQGHHINSVAANPEMAGDPNNIRFVDSWEHLDLHEGNFRIPTSGDLIDRGGPN